MIRLLILVLLVGWQSAIASEQQPLDAVVKIWVDERMLGTGFFISEDGRILTAYHVILGARKIRVLQHEGSSSTSVLVESFSPQRDLAILRVLNLRKPVAYLRLTPNLPTNGPAETLWIFGHGAYIEDSEIPAHMISHRFRFTQELRGSRGERIFALDNVRVIYLDADIHNGMSGGPIVSSGGVIGVLSGSLGQGGNYSWGIPSDYAQSHFMVPVNKAPEEISSWPPLELMSTGWKELRAIVAVGPEAASTIDRYFTTLEKIRAHHERMPALAFKALTYLQIYRGVLESGVNPPDSMSDQVYDGLQAFSRESDDTNQERAAIATSLLVLGQEVERTVDGFPTTQSNTLLHAHFEKAARAANEEWDKGAKAYLDNEQANLQRFINLTSELSKSEVTLTNRARACVEAEAVLKTYAGIDYNRFAAADIEMLEKTGKTIQDILSARFETSTEAWRFISERGYAIDFPAGWNLAVYPPAPETLSDTGLRTLERLNAEARQFSPNITFEALLNSKYIKNEIGQEELVLLKIYFRSSLPEGKRAPVTDSDREILAQMVEQQGFRDVKVERELLNGKWVTSVRANFDEKPGKPMTKYTADIEGPHGEILTLQFFVSAPHAASVIPACRSVIKSAEFK